MSSCIISIGCRKGPHNAISLSGELKMTNLARYTTANMADLLNAINRNAIGMDEYFDRIAHLHETSSNYPPYNLIEVNNVEKVLELALAGFKKEEVNVFTEYGKLFVEGQKQDTESEKTFIHKGVASRSFKRAWTLPDDIKVESVEFVDGLLSIRLKKIVPDHHQRQDYL